MWPPQTKIHLALQAAAPAAIYSQHQWLGACGFTFLPLNEVSAAGVALTLCRNIISRRKAEPQLKEEKQVNRERQTDKSEYE